MSSTGRLIVIYSGASAHNGSTWYTKLSHPGDQVPGMIYRARRFRKSTTWLVAEKITEDLPTQHTYICSSVQQQLVDSYLPLVEQCMKLPLQ